MHEFSTAGTVRQRQLRVVLAVHASVAVCVYIVSVFVFYAVSKHVVIVDCRPGCGRMAANGKLDVGGRGREGGSEM